MLGLSNVKGASLMNNQENDYKQAETISFGGLIVGLALSVFWYLVDQITSGAGGVLHDIAEPLFFASVIFAGLFPPLWLYYSYVRQRNS